jgi:hypothetical protein
LSTYVTQLWHSHSTTSETLWSNEQTNNIRIGCTSLWTDNDYPNFVVVQVQAI